MANGPTPQLDPRQREMARALFGDDLGKLIEMAQRMKQIEKPAGLPHTPPSPETIQKLVRLSFEDSPRGAAARAAWRQILAGALVLVQMWADDQPGNEAP